MYILRFKGNSLRVIISILIAVVLCSGCSFNLPISKYSLVSTKPVASPVQKEKKVIGRDCVYIISFIPTGLGADMGQAVKDALKKGNGDVLIDGEIYHYGWWIPFIYGKGCFMAEGWIGKYKNIQENSNEN